MVNAQHVEVRPGTLPAGFFDERSKPCSNVAALVRKSSERNRRPTNLGDERARTVEDVDVLMHRESCVRKTRPFVIAGNDEDRHAEVRDTTKRVERLIGDGRHDRWPIEDIARVHHDVDFARKRRRERRGVVGEEIVAAAPSSDAWADGQIEPEVRVCE